MEGGGESGGNVATAAGLLRGAGQRDAAVFSAGNSGLAGGLDGVPRAGVQQLQLFVFGRIQQAGVLSGGLFEGGGTVRCIFIVLAGGVWGEMFGGVGEEVKPERASFPDGV